MVQYGFFFDQSRCSGCQTCAVACKSHNALPAGPLKYLRIYEYEKGAFPAVRLHVHWVACYHCERPACVESCPTGAMYKEDKYGAVLIDPEECVGCRTCHEACPYGAPVWENDEKGNTAQKCDMCIARLEHGDAPICVLSCPLRALDFGPLEELEADYGPNRDLEDLPKSDSTRPAVRFKASPQKRQLVPYDAERALPLLMHRDALPRVFSSAADVTMLSEGLVGRNLLVLKHASCAELMRYTRNDEG